MRIGIEHIGIFSKDTAKLKDWYMDMFDWKLVYDNGKGTYFLKADDGMMIEFVKSDIDGGSHDMKAVGIRHIAVSVDNFEEFSKRIEEKGVKILSGATVNAKGVGTMFFEDPDGNVLHLISRPSPL